MPVGGVQREQVRQHPGLGLFDPNQHLARGAARDRPGAIQPYQSLVDLELAGHERDLQILAQQLTLRSIKGSYGPTLGASTGLSDVGSNIPGLTWNWSAGLVLTVPIFQGGLTRAQVREAQANLAVIQAQADGERQQVALEVEQARLAVRADKEALAASVEALANAHVLLQLAEGRYETGVGSIIELGDAQVALTSAGQQKVQAEYNLSQARAQLLKAVGRD